MTSANSCSIWLQEESQTQEKARQVSENLHITSGSRAQHNCKTVYVQLEIYITWLQEKLPVSELWKEDNTKSSCSVLYQGYLAELIRWKRFTVWSLFLDWWEKVLTAIHKSQISGIFSSLETVPPFCSPAENHYFQISWGHRSQGPSSRFYLRHTPHSNFITKTNPI